MDIGIYFLANLEKGNNVEEIFFESVDRALTLAHPGARNNMLFFPGGRNGPYLDFESPIRNSAHWLLSFSCAYSLNKKKSYKVTAEKLMNFLMDDTSYRFQEIPIQRSKEGKDSCNGVIGQAWLAEAFIYFGHIFNDKKAFNWGVKLLLEFPFSKEIGAWERVDPFRGNLGIDQTFNHQSWYASVAADAHLFSSNLELNNMVNKFLDEADRASFEIQPSGLIIHNLNNIQKKRNLKSLIKKVLGRTAKATAPAVTRDLGYQLYDLYSLARLKVTRPDHRIWNSQKVEKALEFSCSDQFFDQLRDNPYSYPYNGPGFEYPLISLAFGDQQKDLQELMKKAMDTQIEKTYSKTERLFCLGTPDSATLSARIYELGIYLYWKNIRSRI